MAEIIEYCTHPSEVILAGPIKEALDQTDEELRNLLDLIPSSDAVAVLRRYRDRLQTALTRARKRRIYVTPEIAARYLRIGVPAVTRLCRLGHLDADHIGTRWWIGRDALLRYGRRPR